MANFEIVVIGGGVIGSSIAYHLARQGRHVLVVERAEVAVEPTASWASAGGVRRQGRDPAEAALASEAIARWPSLEAELDADVHYRQGGNLLLAETEAEATGLVTFVTQQQAMGFSDVRLVDQYEVREIMPYAAPQILAGSYSPADGQADPALTTRALAQAAIRHGATYWTGVTCEALLKVGERVTGVLTDQGKLGAEAVVLAAGVWSDELAHSVGLRLPIETRAPQMILSTPAPVGLLTPVLGSVGRALSLKQLNDGSFLIGGGWPGDPTPDRRGFTLRSSSVEGSWATACAVLPAVGQQQVAAAWCGLEAECVDHIPLIGPVPEVEGLTLALGFSGHGFAIAPAVGRAVADRLAGKATPTLDGLSPHRLIKN